MQSLGIFCPICLDYFLKPVTGKCSHSFCQFCLEQYFLHTDCCPICQSSIRKQKLYRSNVLSNFVHNFIQNEHPEYLQQYMQRQKEYKEFKQKKLVDGISVGSKVDIRDSNYFWRVGRVIRLISRIGEAHKFVKVQYLDSKQSIEEQLKIISDRLAKAGFYTKRNDIPRYIQNCCRQ